MKPPKHINSQPFSTEIIEWPSQRKEEIRRVKPSSKEITTVPEAIAVFKRITRKPFPVLSIRQPWAWAILHAGKDVENRSRRTRYRGHFLIHASKGCTVGEYRDACDFIATGHPGGTDVPPLADLPRGGIVGIARITDCVESSDSPWFFGPFGYQLADVKPLEFYPAKGALGFFYLDRVKPIETP